MGFKMTKLQFGTYTIYLISLIICTYKTVNLINGNYDNPQTQIILIILSLICVSIFGFLFLHFIKEDI